ncbi:hypothetical protein [Methanimicrococcus hacksteinii]|uniref:hypothetical protein n=1 Tax=Methanimicrococcus hacksteinii TaxID=3028293 RepID=UPI00298F0E96|nr:hypothetical protein [Methanimicrococcus sp. At1]
MNMSEKGNKNNIKNQNKCVYKKGRIPYERVACEVNEQIIKYCKKQKWENYSIKKIPGQVKEKKNTF